MTTNPDDKILGELDPAPSTVDGTALFYIDQGGQGYKIALSVLESLVHPAGKVG